MNFPFSTNKILFAKLRDDAVIPTKRYEDAGYDIYPVLDSEDIHIYPHETVKIHTGIASAFSPDKVVVIKERSSTGSKGLEQRCGIIDSGYRGEWIIPLTNGTDKRMVITRNPESYMDTMWTAFPASKAIAQALLLWLPNSESEEVPREVIESLASQRQDGGFGSSGK